ncbi:MAG: PHP domain-containing protein, partial [Mogibacterium sp.]|nr:PHP domain-containing protein [Mogibacterium sp.]
MKNNNKNIAELIMSDMKKDLHIHTCYSDGIFTPEEVVDRWKAEGYKLIAITDHDGMDGSIIGMDYARGSGIMFISGIEFDSEDALGRDMH